MEIVLSPCRRSQRIRPRRLWRAGNASSGDGVEAGTGRNRALRAGDAQTDANGAFRIGNLGPGEYRIAAWVVPPAGGAFTPELLS